MSATDELNKLKKLHDDGTITDEQFERAKAKLFDPEDAREGEGDREARRPRGRRDEDEYEYEDDEEYARAADVPGRKKVREWSMLLHLSLFAGHAVPLGGIIAPIVLWQMKKDEWPEIDEHGKNAVNWVISFVIYMAISIVLCFVFIGFVLFPIVCVLGVVFPIIAAVKANEGQAWKYPLAITFLK